MENLMVNHITLMALFGIAGLTAADLKKPTITPETAVIVADLKNNVLKHDLLGNLARGARIAVRVIKDLALDPEFSRPYPGRFDPYLSNRFKRWGTIHAILRDRKEIDKETQGGEGLIFKLTEKHPYLKKYETEMLEINYAHNPNPSIVSLLNKKLGNYQKIFFTNAATQTVQTWQQRYPELLKDAEIAYPTVDRRNLKTGKGNPFIFNNIKQKLYGTDIVPTISELKHAQIPEDIIQGGKKIVMIANEDKIKAAIKAGLPIIASYAYSSSSDIGKIRDRLTPEWFRMWRLKRSLSSQGVKW